jgi:hypothetical protein
MRATEFITERKKGIHKHAMASLPYGQQFHGADQYYDYYRLGIMAAGAPHQEAPTEGPAKDTPTAWAYSDADEEKINYAAKKLGYKSKTVVKKGSLEPEGTHTVSPVANWMKR